MGPDIFRVCASHNRLICGSSCVYRAKIHFIFLKNRSFACDVTVAMLVDLNKEMGALL